jgi:hypothetical protein
LKTFRFPESLVLLGSYAHPSSATTIYWDAINFTNTYSLNSNTSSSNSTIKKVVFGKKVTVIPTNFCYNLDAITAIDIPNSVTQIGNSAFRDCSKLVTVEIGDSLVGIHTYAFYNCTSLKSIVLPKSVAAINSYAFSGCTSLNSIKFSEGLSKIDAYAFQNCTSLDSIKLPNSITSIGNYAFTSCTKLTTFTFPENLVSIGINVHPSNVKTIYWDAINYVGTYSLNSNTSYPNNTIEKVIFGKKVKLIPQNLCYNLDAITAIELPNSITQVGNAAFRDCSKLVSIEVGDSLETIDEYAFYYCS